MFPFEKMRTCNDLLHPVRSWFLVRLLAPGALSGLLLFFSGCITWISGDEPARVSATSGVQHRNLTISLRYRTNEPAPMTDRARAEYNAEIATLLAPGIERISSLNAFSSVRLVESAPPAEGFHWHIEQTSQHSGAWSRLNGGLAALTLNFLPTYMTVIHKMQVSLYRDGQEIEQYTHSFVFHSANWNLFIPIWLIRPSQNATEDMYRTLFECIVRDMQRTRALH